MGFLKKIFSSLLGRKSAAVPSVEDVSSVSATTPADEHDEHSEQAAAGRATLRERLALSRQLMTEETEDSQEFSLPKTGHKPLAPAAIEPPRAEAGAAFSDEGAGHGLVRDESSAQPLIHKTTTEETAFGAAPGVAGEAGETDDFEDDFDDAFDRIFSGSSGDAAGTPAIAATGATDEQPAAAPKAAPVFTAADLREVHALFADIAANYARPIKSFIHELKRSPVTRDWIEICRPALESIRKAAESMDFADASRHMSDFSTALSLAQSNDDRMITGDHRDLILNIYDAMVEVLPQTFTLSEEEHLREGIIIHSLLKQIPDAGRVSRDKLFAVGLTSLDAIFVARSDDLAVTTGIPAWICDKIVRKFMDFKNEVEGNKEGDAQEGLNRRLDDLLADLKEQHASFELASSTEWTNPELTRQKKIHRQKRQEIALQIQVLLAEMSEFELLDTFQKMPFEERIRTLDQLSVRRHGQEPGVV